MYELHCFGHLGRDAEVKTDKAGKKYVAFSVGVKKHDGNTEWVYCTKEGEYFSDIIKGTGIFFRGEPFSYNKTDKNTGETSIAQGCRINFLRVFSRPFGALNTYTPPKTSPMPESDRQKAVGNGLAPRVKYDSIPPADDDLPF